MTIREAIEKRSSIRHYKSCPVSKEDMDLLLNAAVHAPSGSNLQPLGFVVINDREEIDALSDEIKAYLHSHVEDTPGLKRYRRWFTNEKFHVFNHAPTVLVIYGNEEVSRWGVYDGTLAAANVTYLGMDLGIGSCLIGFAQSYFDLPAFKEKHHVPESFKLVTTLSLGYLAEGVDYHPSERKEPLVFDR